MVAKSADPGDPQVNDSDQRPRVQSAARTVGILLAVSQSDTGLSTKEISEKVGIGRQATYHLLHTLVQTGILTRDDRNRYLLGLRAGTLAEGFARQLAPAEHLAPLVRELAYATGETAYASGWWLGEIMTLSSARGTRPVRAGDVPQGYAGNAHARASGKLLLAFASQATRDAYLKHHKLERLTPNTITNRTALEEEFSRIRDRGYAVDNEELALGLCCLAVPLDGGYSPFVLAVSAPRSRYLEEEQNYLQAMRRVAELRPDALSPSEAE